MITSSERLSAECCYLFLLDLSKLNLYQAKKINEIVKEKNKSNFRLVVRILWGKLNTFPGLIREIKKFLSEKIQFNLIDSQNKKSINELIKSNIERSETLQNILG